MAMRTMTHHGRGKGRSGHTFGSKHDDRNFEIEKANNIDPELTKENIYWSIFEGYTFEDAELKFYEDNFSEQLEQTNQKYRMNGHPERCKDMAAWKNIRQHAPEESIYQIGDKHNTGQHADAFTLHQCFILFAAEERKWNREHGNPFTLLNYALHVDEPNCPPHIHSRKAWHYTAEDGTLRIGQERALELAGIELPHPDKPLGRYNNRKMVYDAMMREKWLDILASYGIEVEREPLPDGKGKKSKTREEYIRDKYDALTHELEDLCQIKTMAERDQVAAEATAQIDELEASFAIVDDFCVAAKDDISHGSPFLQNLVEDLIYDWQRARARISQLIDSIKDKIRNIGIFELLKKVLPEHRVAGTLQERLDKAMSGSQKAVPEKTTTIEQEL